MVKPSYGKMIPKEGDILRLSTIFWGFILFLVIVFIAYEVVNETFIKPVRMFMTEVQETIDETFRLLEP